MFSASNPSLNEATRMGHVGKYFICQPKVLSNLAVRRSLWLPQVVHISAAGRGSHTLALQTAGAHDVATIGMLCNPIPKPCPLSRTWLELETQVGLDQKGLPLADGRKAAAGRNITNTSPAKPIGHIGDAERGSSSNVSVHQSSVGQADGAHKTRVRVFVFVLSAFATGAALAVVLACVDAQVCVHEHMCAHASTCKHTYTCACAWVHACGRPSALCLHVRTRVGMHSYACMPVCTIACGGMCVCGCAP